MRLDVESRAFLDAMEAQGISPIETLPLQDARDAFELLQSFPAPFAGADVEERTAAASDGSVAVHVVRPPGTKGILPVVMYLHGGGWILGSFKSYERLVRDIAAESGAAVVFVNYTLSPEAQFPKPLEQAYAVLSFLAERGGEWNLDGSRIAVAGDSAGGAMAAAVCLLAAERGGPAVRLQVLLCPMVSADFTADSCREFAGGPVITLAALEKFWDAYAPDRSVRTDPLAAPLQASTGELRHMPPALVITSENDVVRDHGDAYAGRLMEAGVPVTAARYIGTVHDFMMINALAHSPAARSAIDMSCAAIRRALGESDRFLRTGSA